jgi:hypothetical protein
MNGAKIGPTRGSRGSLAARRSSSCAPHILDPGRTYAVAGLSPNCGVIALARIVLRLLADLAGLVVVSLIPRRSVEAESAWTD